MSRCLPHSLADEKHVCSLARPGQRRASLLSTAAHDFPTLAAEPPNRLFCMSDDFGDMYRPSEEHEAFRAAVRELCDEKVGRASCRERVYHPV